MPCTFDLPKEDLYSYRGRNPRPADFDAFWESGLLEMRAVDPCIEIVAAGVPCAFAECSHLFFNGVGGSRIHAKLLRPRASTKPGPALLHFHGYSGDSGCWTQHMAYAAAGFTVAAMDCRGQGGQSQDLGSPSGMTLRGHVVRGLDDPDPRNLLFRRIFLDTAQLAGIVMEMDGVDPARLAAKGGSQGGGLTLACAALEPRVVRAAPAYPFLCDYKRVWEMDLARDAYDELAYFFRSVDPLHAHEDKFFERLGYIDVQHLAPRIRAKVLMATSLRDTICPPSAQFAAFNKISSEKECVFYPDFGHEQLNGHDDRVWEFLAPLLD